jgi:hypothetical protein
MATPSFFRDAPVRKARVSVEGRFPVGWRRTTNRVEKNTKGGGTFHSAKTRPLKGGPAGAEKPESAVDLKAIFSQI